MSKKAQAATKKAEAAQAAAAKANASAQAAAKAAEEKNTKELAKKKLTKKQMAAKQKAFEARQKKIVAKAQKAAAKKLAARIAAIKKTLHGKNAERLTKQLAKTSAGLSKHQQGLKKQAATHAAQNARVHKAAAGLRAHKELVAKDKAKQKELAGAKFKPLQRFWRNV